MTYFKSVLLILVLAPAAKAQDETPLIEKLKQKLNQVHEYDATGKMKTDVALIKAPVGNVKKYYQQPNHFKLVRDGGFSILPKGGISITMNSIFAINNSVALSAGNAMVDGYSTKIVKLLPMNENNDIVLTTLYIDEKNLLIRKAITTTKENGTYQIAMQYGQYSNWGLPNKVIFTFNTQDYKIPKGVTLEMGEPLTDADRKRMQQKNGRVEIDYTSYTINKGLPSGIFN
jgi:outer membrane lipoprotein-sorting protein